MGCEVSLITHMSNIINQQIEARVQAFVQELSALVKSAALDAVSGALGGSSTALTHARRGRPPGSKNKKSAAAPQGVRRAKRGKRTTAQVDQMGARVLDHVKKHPGQGVERISKALRLKSKELTLPIGRLLESKKLKTTGQRRGTKYFAR
jgi:hypothetical protein